MKFNQYICKSVYVLNHSTLVVSEKASSETL